MLACYVIGLLWADRDCASLPASATPVSPNQTKHPSARMIWIWPHAGPAGQVSNSLPARASPVRRAQRRASLARLARTRRGAGGRLGKRTAHGSDVELALRHTDATVPRVATGFCIIVDGR